jgi:transposase InsO family protein
LFYKFPQIQETIDNMFLKKTEKGIVHESRIPLKSIHKRFLESCRQAGIKADEYPFTVKNTGRIALWKYLKKLFNQQPTKATKARYGKDVSRRLKSQGSGQFDDEGEEAVVRPYQRVEFDAHLIDLFCTITLPSIYGGTVEKVLDRIWLLLIIDVLTRCVLGYHLSFGKQYSAEDVLLCIKNAVTPWQPKKLTIPALKYPEKGGLPSGVFEEAKWALWDEFAYDNAKANLADRVREKLTSVVNCAVNAGPVETPERRPFIERFFGILEENGYHRLPSTTGSSPTDSRRNDPEKNALDLHISLEHIEELTDVLIAQYNATPHSGIGFRSPLEHLEYFINSDNIILPRQLLKVQRNHLNLLNIQLTRSVRGSREKGVGAHINFEGVRYRNDVLSRSPDLIGQKLTIVIDPQDIRSIFAFLPSGAEFGILTAQGKWGRTPHTLEMRQAIFALRNKKLIWYTEQDDPVHVYLDYLGREALKSKNARRKYAGVQQANKHRENKSHPTLSPSPSTLQPKKQRSSINEINGLSRKEEDERLEKNRRFSLPKLKTFTY